jgi:extradiol dioxygenase family protein
MTGALTVSIRLIDTTNVEESKEVYSTKLGLSMGRSASV